MYKFIFSILFCFLNLNQSHANSIHFECRNNSILIDSMTLSLDGKSWFLNDEFNNECELKQSGTPLLNSNYSGWIVVTPSNSNENNCLNLKKTFSIKPRAIYELILDTEIQASRTGFARLKYQSQGREYGPDKIKSFLKCFPL